MPRATRDRILASAAELMRRDGYAGTGLKAVVAAAQAPFGSLYHFFPGGKEQLAAEVLRDGGRFYLANVTAVVDAAPDLITGLEWAFSGAASALIDSDFADACPIATMALEVSSSNENLRGVAAEAFRSWVEALAARLATAGVPAGRTEPLAYAVLSLLEGAFVLSQTLRDVGPILAAGDAAVAQLRAALAAAG